MAFLVPTKEGLGGDCTNFRASIPTSGWREILLLKSNVLNFDSTKVGLSNASSVCDVDPCLAVTKSESVQVILFTQDKQFDAHILNSLSSNNSV